MSNFEKFGKYILLEKLAVGGMAEVYLAKSAGASGVNKFVAIKRILPQFSNNQEFREMFEEEAKVSVNLNHSNVVSIYDFGIENGQFYIVMEFVEGRNLRQIINELKKHNRSIKTEEAIFLIKEAAAGLDHAHRCVDQHTGRPLNITHRDMSPQNIMVSFEGEAKVIDFGIAKKSEPSGEATRAGTLKGKFAYMSPEQAEAEEVDPRTDIFALGIILWELLANDRLFTGSNENAILRKVRDCQIPSIRKINPMIPSELERIVTKALAKDRNIRYQTAAALQKDLNRFLNTQYPDFSAQDLSKTIIDSFKGAYQEAREKLVTYSKVEVSDITPPPTENIKEVASTEAKAVKITQPNNIPDFKNDPEPQGLNNDGVSKVDLGGLKEAAKHQFGRNAIHAANISSIGRQNTTLSQNKQRVTLQETNINPNTRITHNTSIGSNKNTNSLDIFVKLIIVACMGVGGYYGYSKFLTPKNNIERSLAKVKNQSPEENKIATAPSVKISISSQPTLSRIYIDNVDTGRYTPAIISVPANKEVKIQLKKDNYFTYETTRTLNQTSVLAATLQKLPDSAYININVQNGGIQPVVYINNQRLTETPPIRRFSVPANTRITVMAINPVTKLKDEVIVKIDANKEANVDLILGRKRK